MLVYLDMCSIQRPFDDRSQLRVRLEAEAIVIAISLIDAGQLALLSSGALQFETRNNPHPTHKDYALRVLRKATRFVPLSKKVEEHAKELILDGLKPLDALHLAFAVEGGADYFCTCDDRFLKRARVVRSGPPKVVSPLELIGEIAP